MIRKRFTASRFTASRFTASLAAAAVLGASGPAFAQSSSTTVDPDVGVNANVGDHDASRTRGSATSGATAPDEERGEQQGRGHAFGRDRDDKQTGLDRADQAAGEHGRQGRDNARRHQGDRD
ncbi:MAG TPA: hypothetical protein VFI86_06820 [Burkholderiales bacterium]|nr:hypothetical protein [Burkholderiales bacterium]